MTKQQAARWLKNNPHKFGHMLGFTDLTELHQGWMKEMLTCKDDHTLQAHRNSYKTTCVSIVLALIIILLPDRRTLFLRKTDTDVKEIVKQVKNILLHPKTQYFVKCLYGVSLKITVDNATELSTNLTTVITGAPQLTAMGTNSSVTGKHYDYIFTDDIVNLKDRHSRAERERIKTVYGELNNVKKLDGGRIFNTGTPWHPDDAFIKMPEPEKWDCYSTNIMSDEDLQDRKAKLTNSEFAANYELKHIASDDVLFTNPQTGAPAELVKYGKCHTDAAFYGEDYTAFTIINIHDGKFYVFGKLWRKHVDDVSGDIANYYNEYCAEKMWMETNADKGYVAKQFKQNGLRVATYHESQNKYVKISTHLKFEWPDIIFVEGTDQKYIDQICDYNDEAEHDDAPDSLASLIRIMGRKKNETEDEINKYRF